MEEKKAYPPEIYVIETQHGVYPVGAWGFVTSRTTYAEAVWFCERMGSDYRVVKDGVVVYPKQNQQK